MKSLTLVAVAAAGLSATPGTADAQYPPRGYSYPNSYPSYSYPGPGYVTPG